MSPEWAFLIGLLSAAVLGAAATAIVLAVRERLERRSECVLLGQAIRALREDVQAVADAAKVERPPRLADVESLVAGALAAGAAPVMRKVSKDPMRAFDRLTPQEAWALEWEEGGCLGYEDTQFGRVEFPESEMENNRALVRSARKKLEAA